MKKPVIGEFGTSDRWFVLLFLALDYFVLNLHRNVIFFVQPPLKGELGISDAQIGFLDLSFMVPYGLSQFFVGYLGDRVARKTILLLSLTGSIASLVGLGLAGSFEMLVVFRMLLGFSQAASVPAIASVMGDCFTPRSRSTAVAIYLISRQVAVVSSGTIGGEIADIGTWNIQTGALGWGVLSISGWRMAMFIFSFIGALVVFAMYLFLREPERTDREEGKGLGVQGATWWATTKEVLTVRSFWAVAIAFVLAGVTVGVRETWLPRYAHDHLGMNLGSAGWFSTVYLQSATVAGLFLGGIWADRWSKHRRAGRMSVQVVGLFIMSPPFILLGTSTSVPILIGAMLTIGLGFGLYAANIWTTTFEIIDPAARATAMGLLNFISMLAAPFATLVGHGLDENWFDFGDLFVATSLIGGAAFALLIFVILFFLPQDYRGPEK